MLEQLLIFTRGGLILWTYKELSNALKGSPIETLIKSCLLEERSAETSFNYDAGSGGGGAYTLKWTFHNDLGLVFVAVYQRILHLLYVDDLLAAVKREFEQIYDPKRTAYDEFDEIFRQLQKEAEARAEEMRRLKQSGKNPPVLAKKAAAGSQMNKKKNGKNGNSDGNSKKDDGDGDESKERGLANGWMNGKEHDEVKETRSLPNVIVKGKENGNPAVGAFDVNMLQKKVRGKGGKKTETNTNTNMGGGKGEPKKAVKKNRVWNDPPKEEAKLDFTDPVGEGGDEVREVVAVDEGESMMDKEEIVSSESEGEVDEEMESAKPAAKKKGWFSSMIQRYNFFFIPISSFFVGMITSLLGYHLLVRGLMVYYSVSLELNVVFCLCGPSPYKRIIRRHISLFIS